MKTGTIVRAVEAFEAGVDLRVIKEEAEKVKSLKGLVEGYEREIAVSAEMPSTSSRDRPLLEALAGRS